MGAERARERHTQANFPLSMKQFYMIPLTMTYYLVRTRNNSRTVEKQVNRVHMMILMKEINVDSAAVGAREEFFMTIILYPSSR